MEYFRLFQDQRYLHYPEIDNFYKRYRREYFSVASGNKIDDINVVFTPSTKNLDYIDLLDKQVILISSAVKDVFSLYDCSIFYKTFHLLNNLTGLSGLYYAPIIQEIKCLSEKSVCNLNRSVIKNIVLDFNSLKKASIFKIADINTDVLIVRLDVVESLLRRKVKGTIFEKVNLDKE